MAENDTKPLKASEPVCGTCGTSVQTGSGETSLSRERPGNHDRFVVSQYADRWSQRRGMKERGDIQEG